MAPQTRKNKTAGASGHSRRRRVVATTIPELKQSFDALERKVAEILRAGGEQKQRVRKFQEAWRSIFGRPVEAAAAEAYLQVKARTLPKVGAKTRKSQRGGAGGALAGAPLDFQTRPGVDGVHGSFLPYLTKGLDFYNTINQQGMFKGCGTEDITPKIPASLGSNLVGGGSLLSDAAFVATTRPAAASSPPSLLNDLQTAWQGRSLGASPAPDQNPLKYI
jgi:hypothetical protein